MAADHGCKSIKIICRKKMRIQPFDVSHKWVGPDRNKYLAEFWSEKCMRKRKQMMQDAKKPAKFEGYCAATVTREGLTLIKEDIAAGRIEICENCEVSRIELEDNRWRAVMSDDSIEQPHLIWYSFIGYMVLIRPGSQLETHLIFIRIPCLTRFRTISRHLTGFRSSGAT